MIRLLHDERADAGFCLRKAGLLDLAVEYCEKAVEIRRRLMSEEHLDFINSLNSLAALCCKDGQYDRALEVHREVLEIVERTAGEGSIFFMRMR